MRKKAARPASSEDDCVMSGVEADDLAAQRGRAFAVEVAGKIERLPRLPTVAPAPANSKFCATASFEYHSRAASSYTRSIAR